MKKGTVIGKKFGRLLVLEEFSVCSSSRRRMKCKCLCDCGNMTVVYKQNLLQGNTQSCGCYRDERIREVNSRHGMSSSHIFDCWSHMKSRCDNPKNIGYKNYGGRGISYCSEWNDFSVFLKWSLENGYKSGLTIDRIDNNKDYTPENCRWATRYQQNNNRRCNIKITYNGETHTLSQWCKLLDLKYPRTYYRVVVKGWGAEQAFRKEKLNGLAI